MNNQQTVEKSFVQYDQYNPDKLHYSNWCRKCGYYYCWHKESPASSESTYRKHLVYHPFEPMRSQEDYHDNWDYIIEIPTWLFDGEMKHE